MKLHAVAFWAPLLCAAGLIWGAVVLSNNGHGWLAIALFLLAMLALGFASGWVGARHKPN